MKLLKSMCFLFLAMGLFMTGCSTTNKQVTKIKPIQDLGAPAWVSKGSGAFGGEKGKVFYGVGSSSDIKNESLLRSSADGKARNDIAKTLNTYTASLLKEYRAATAAGDPNVTSEEMHVEEAVKNVTVATISGVEIVDHWQNPETGALYSLARIDFEAFKDSLERANELSARARDFIRKNADRLHDQLEKEEMKAAEKAQTAGE